MTKPVRQTAPTPGAALRNAFAPSALQFTQRSFDSGDQWGRVYAITDFPPSVDAGWLATVANLDGIVLSVHALPTDPTAITMAMSRAISLLAGQLSTGGTALSQQRQEQQLQDAQALLRKIDAEQQSVWTVGVVLLVNAPDEATGLRRSKRLEGLLAAAGMRARPLAFRQEEGLKAVGPWGLFPESLRGGAPFQLPAETLAAAFPFSSGGINHGHGIVLGHDSSGGLVLVDCWNPPPDAGISNKNFAILSPPGGGKSHAVKLRMLREWAMGARVIVVDPEREYRILSHNLGGAWLNAAGGATKINPFQAPALPPDTDDTGLELAVTSIGIHIQRVQGFLTTYLPDLTAMQRALLDQAVEEVYQAKDITLTTDPATVAAEGWPHMGDLHRACKAHAEAEPATEWPTIAALLRNAGEGTTAQLWAGASTVPDVQSADFVVLDIHDLQDAPENVKRAQFLNVLGYAWDLIRADRSEKKLLVVDEAWMLIDPKAPEALKFMKSLSKRIRKYNGSFSVVTQNVVDFLHDAVRGDGEQVLTNSAFTLLLRQGGRDLTALTDLFQLSEAEQEKLRNARVGEGLLIAGNHRAWVTIDTAPHETSLIYG